jgi:hypothetical protein
MVVPTTVEPQESDRTQDHIFIDLTDPDLGTPAPEPQKNDSTQDCTITNLMDDNTPDQAENLTEHNSDTNLEEPKVHEPTQPTLMIDLSPDNSTTPAQSLIKDNDKRPAIPPAESIQLRPLCNLESKFPSACLPTSIKWPRPSCSTQEHSGNFSPSRTNAFLGLPATGFLSMAGLPPAPPENIQQPQQQ